jgi:2-dehydro-3-deoxyphosphooctonate aldolase (KDO 8-P synthase)
LSPQPTPRCPTRRVEVGHAACFGGGAPPSFIAGPCVIESREHALRMAALLAEVARRQGVGLVYKSSFDKANRSSGASFRGPGIDEGLRILEEVRDATGLPVLSDVHEPAQARAAGEVLDALQVPAFLCRQTDLLLAAFGSGRAVSVKKGQFLSPTEARNVLEKAADAGCERVLLTERGTTFGYHDLVVDMRSLPLMRAFGAPVVLDVTHGLQRPGAGGDRSGGTPELAEPIARAGAGAGCDGFFLEVHDDPPQARSDAATQVRPEVFERIVSQVVRIDAVARESEREGA